MPFSCAYSDTIARIEWVTAMLLSLLRCGVQGKSLNDCHVCCYSEACERDALGPGWLRGDNYTIARSVSVRSVSAGELDRIMYNMAPPPAQALPAQLPPPPQPRAQQPHAADGADAPRLGGVGALQPGEEHAGAPQGAAGIGAPQPGEQHAGAPEGAAGIGALQPGEQDAGAPQEATGTVGALPPAGGPWSGSVFLTRTLPENQAVLGRSFPQLAFAKTAREAMDQAYVLQAYLPLHTVIPSPASSGHSAAMRVCIQ